MSVAMLIHIAETAALLLVAYSMGWVVGYIARRSAASARQKPAAVIPAERLAAAKGEVPASDALVTAPVVAPLKAAPPPKASPVPEEAITILGELGKLAVPDQPPAATISMDAVAPAEPEPVRTDARVAFAEPVVVVAAESPSTPDSATMAVDETAKPDPAPQAASAIADEPRPAASDAGAKPAMPASKPGEAWSGEIRGHASPRHDELLLPPTEPEPLRPVAPVRARPQPDEDAAMRAIEGGWSRRDAHALPDEPELIGVVAAVSAAQSAVEKALSKLEDDAPVDAATKS